MSSQLPLKIASGEVDRFVASTDFIAETVGGTGETTYTEGDLLVGDAGAGLTKLAVGTNGQVLTSDGTTVAWATPTSVTVTEVVDLTNDESGALLVGNVVYADAAGGCKKAKADASGTSRVVGIALNAAAASAATHVQTCGVVTLTTGQWDAVFGTTGGLAFNTPYYLSAGTAGAGTATAPDTTGQFLTFIGYGLSATQLKLNIEKPMGL